MIQYTKKGMNICDYYMTVLTISYFKPDELIDILILKMIQLQAHFITLYQFYCLFPRKLYCITYT